MPQPQWQVGPQPQIWEVAQKKQQAQSLEARAVAVGIPRWAVRFPSLWQAIQQLISNLRQRVTVEQLRGLLRKYGPSFLVGMIGEAAVRELVTYDMTRKRRRMNPANARALRRSLRRLRSFERLSSRVSLQLNRACRTRRHKKMCA
jgi:hypothetical protein